MIHGEEPRMFDSLHNLGIPWSFRWYLIFPLLITLWIAWGDLKTHRIPNYLTFGVALAGLGLQLGCHGWSGLCDSLLGLALGFGLLIIPYMLGGMGAGDVKALAALGAWLGPLLTFHLFLYMALAGGLISLGSLCWQRLLGFKIRQASAFLVNIILCRSYGPAPITSTSSETKVIPYGVALALGMLALLVVGE
jgi:prepilin peptidase CpaA